MCLSACANANANRLNEYWMVWHCGLLRAIVHKYSVDFISVIAQQWLNSVIILLIFLSIVHLHNNDLGGGNGVRFTV